MNALNYDLSFRILLTENTHFNFFVFVLVSEFHRVPALVHMNPLEFFLN